MLFRQFRQLSLLIIFCLACLQGLAPLLHAHPEGQASSNAQSGIHLHEINAKSFEHFAGYSILTDVSPHAMEVGLAHHPKDVLLVLPILAWFALIALCYPLGWRSSGWQQRKVHHVPLPRYFGSLLRAPPQH